MSGPCSLPNGSKKEWNEHNEIVCDIHFHCNMQELDQRGTVVKHNFITYRLWLAKRGKLRTGKTV